MKSLCISILSVAMLGGCAHRQPDHPVYLLGHAIPPGAAEKTIVLGPDTRAVNVTGGDAVRFVVGEREFGWAFDVGWVVTSVDLAQVAPPGLLRQPVIAYVAPDPHDSGGGDRDD